MYTYLFQLFYFIMELYDTLGVRWFLSPRINSPDVIFVDKDICTHQFLSEYLVSQKYILLSIILLLTVSNPSMFFLHFYPLLADFNESITVPYYVKTVAISLWVYWLLQLLHFPLMVFILLFRQLILSMISIKPPPPLAMMHFQFLKTTSSKLLRTLLQIRQRLMKLPSLPTILAPQLPLHNTHTRRRSASRTNDK